MNFPETYELLLKDSVEELNAEGYILRHKKSGAHLFLLDNDDENKVFDIIFKTTPENSTGVAHIMEHSVLCGSEKYPAKDPFVELAKGSLNTFLNAMTFPEKTMYPVASTNDADFRNLMSVYMDAVLKPNIYTNEKIFRQEGWHYELTDRDGELSYNGVVYNEMRGAFSDPDGLLERYTLNGLFPDTTYANESGGDPSVIPELSYGDFLDFHRRFYHPSNSYIYLYGNVDFTERLQWLDREYLSHYEAIDPKTEMKEQAPFKELHRQRIPYGISEGEEETHYYSYAKVVGGLMDPVQCLAFDVLSYALLNAPGAPLRQALLDAGLGDDVYGGFDSSVRQPFFNVVVKGAEGGREEEFLSIIEEVLRRVSTEGLNRRTLEAGIHNEEFSLREGDYGRTPKGLVMGIGASETWIHDELSPMLHLRYNAAFEALKARLGTGYFERLVAEKLLENPHGLLLDLAPEKGLNDERDRALAESLAAYKASLAPEELDRIIAGTKELKAYQTEPSSQEDLLKIPMLRLEDIGKKARGFINEELKLGPVPALYHRVHSSGIAYLELRFSLASFPAEDLPYFSLLRNLYTQMDTEHYSYPELNDEISLSSGGIGATAAAFAMAEDPDSVKVEFGVGARCLVQECGETVRLMREVMFGTSFRDAKRLRELIAEQRSQLQTALVSAGHQTAVRRALSYTVKSSAADELLNGISFFRFLWELEKHFDERKEALIEKLEALSGKLFRKDNALFSVACDPEATETVKAALLPLAEQLSDESLPETEPVLPLELKNEGIMTSSQVQYVCAAGNMKQAGFAYSGTLEVLRTILSYEYLWQNLRVKGGAYGCMASFRRNGAAALVSYRDPNLSETLQVYRGLPGYLRSLELDGRDMTKYIIGTISDYDAPMSPSAAALRSLAAYESGLTEELVQRERDEILSADTEKLRALAEPFERLLSRNLLAVVGGEARIREQSGLFGELTTLTGENNE